MKGKSVIDFLAYLMTQETEKQKEAVKKGKQGEKDVKKSVDSLGLKCLTNLYIPNGYGTSEIDLLFVDKTGVYVIEVKNYRATIYGDSVADYWNAVYSSNITYKMYNPIKQNDTHLKVLNYLFKGKLRGKLKSYVVFNNDSNLSNIYNHRRDVLVCHDAVFKNILPDEIDNGKIVFTDSEVDYIYDFLKPYMKVKKSVKKQHIEDIKEKKKK